MSETNQSTSDLIDALFIKIYESQQAQAASIQALQKDVQQLRKELDKNTLIMWRKPRTLTAIQNHVIVIFAAALVAGMIAYAKKIWEYLD